MKKFWFLFMAVVLLIVGGTTFWLTKDYNLNYNNLENALETSNSYNNKDIQQALKDKGYYNGSIDGILGSKSKAAVKSFQKDNGLTADGIVGPKTAVALGVMEDVSDISSASLDLLAKAVYAEARGEPYEGQVAIAAVVLNRVKNANFPNSISGVIYQPQAFTAVDDGQINLTPNQTAYNAARDALNGWDPTSGCIYYYNPKTATSQWIFSRTTMITIGRHRFCI